MAQKYVYELINNMEDALCRYQQLCECYHEVELTKMEFVIANKTFYSIRYR